MPASSFHYSVGATNHLKQRVIDYCHSESDLNAWGHTLLRQSETQKAMEVFKLNTVLHPQSSNAFESLVGAYLSSGNKELAKINYRKSLELNLKNTNAAEVFKTL